MEERLRFVARLLDGEKMAPLCVEFGISRKTGYKIYDRCKACGIDAFTDRSRRRDVSRRSRRRGLLLRRRLPLRLRDRGRLFSSRQREPVPGASKMPPQNGSIRG